MERLPTRGRHKAQSKIIENEKERAVTLSKRRNGLFKKANEIATLCGAQIMIIVFTIVGRRHSFGSPNVCSIMNKFLNPQDHSTRVVNSFNESKLQVLNREFDDVNEKLIYEKKQGEILGKYLKSQLGGKRYEEYIGNIGVDELKELQYNLDKLKTNLEGKMGSTSGSSSSSCENNVDLSKIEGPRDYLRLY